MVGALVGHSLVGVADLGGLPTPEPSTGSSILVEHHRCDVAKGILVGPGSRVDDGRRTGHGDYGDGAFVPFEPLIHVVGLPGTYFFVLGDAHSEFGWQADKVGISRPGVTIADVNQAQAQRPAYRRVGAVDDSRPHGRRTDVQPRLLCDGSVHQDYGRFRMAGNLHVPVVHLGLGQAVNGGQ